MKNKNTSYSWPQILWPFNHFFIKTYKTFSSEQKSAFWSIAASTTVTVLTFWLGLTVQQMVYDANQTEEYKTSHYQVVDRFQPVYIKLCDSLSDDFMRLEYAVTEMARKQGTSIKDVTFLNDDDSDLDDIMSKLDEHNLSKEKEEDPTTYVLKYYRDKDHISELLNVGMRTFDISSSIAPYLSREKMAELYTNNLTIMLGTAILHSAFNDDTTQDSTIFVSSLRAKFIRTSVTHALPTFYQQFENLASRGYSQYKSIREMYNLLTDLQKSVQGLKDRFDKLLPGSADEVADKIVDFSQAKVFKTSASGFFQFLTQPIILNQKIISDEFMPRNSNTKEIWVRSVIVLFLALLIGFYIMRIFMMKGLVGNYTRDTENEKQFLLIQQAFTELQEENQRSSIKIAALMTEVAEQKRERSKEVDALRTQIEEKERTIESLKSRLKD